LYRPILKYFYSVLMASLGVNPAEDRGTRPPKNVGSGTVMLNHVPPPNVAEISLHKLQRIRLIVVSYYDLVNVLSAYGN